MQAKTPKPGNQIRSDENEAPASAAAQAWPATAGPGNSTSKREQKHHKPTTAGQVSAPRTAPPAHGLLRLLPPANRHGYKSAAFHLNHLLLPQRPVHQLDPVQTWRNANRAGCVPVIASIRSEERRV